ncbi:MAG TPA: Rieske 2Fe-2S domain-containing protein [Terriglobales bacterium]|nr:Rieske 2Fe-2S domain-containing protein [Terriglobales bacterium]
MPVKDAMLTLVPDFEQAEPFRPSRRRFVRALLGGSLVASAASFLYPVLRYVVPPPATDMGGDTVLAAKTDELKPNSAKIFKFGSKPGLLVRTAEGEYRAVSAVCTHLSCTVQYKPDVHQVWCACHNGLYGLDGRNVSGPPPRPLEAYDVHLQGDQVVVSRKREA